MEEMKRSKFYNYPQPEEGPKTSWAFKPGTNPVVKGVPLLAVASLTTTFNFVSSFLWSNAGFKALRSIPELGDHEPRYDPTVIPVADPGARRHNLKDLPFGTPRENSGSAERARSVADFHSAYLSGRVTPLQVAQTFLDTLAASSEHQKAFLDVQQEFVLQAARASTDRYKSGDQISPLDGVLVGIKDEVDLAGHTKSLGSNRQFAKKHVKTSWCVSKWQEAGAVIVGKLNMHELGMDTTNNNPFRGTPLNPHNPEYYTGGSSGGSAYAVAAGLLPIALGADGGGSIRIPSSYCGIFGLKPSHGRVSGSPTQSLAFSCGVLGPMAGSMADLELAYRIMAQPDPAYPASASFPSPLTTVRLSGPEKRGVIGIFRPWIGAADALVRSIFEEALDGYQAVGYEIVDIDLPFLDEGQVAHAMTILAEISAHFYPNIGDLQAANKLLLCVGHQTPSQDLLLAQKMRHLLMKHLAHLFHTHPGLLIVSPTTPNLGWPIVSGASELKHGFQDANMSLRSMIYIWLANFTGCPAITIPIGSANPEIGKGKIPVGMMAMTEWGGEDALIQWGKEGETWAQEAKSIPVPNNRVDLLEVLKMK